MLKVLEHFNCTVPDTAHVIKYKVINGTAYHEKTPDQVISIIEEARQNKNIRLRFCFGDTDTGKDWDEKYDVEGYIGRSCGRIKIPLLIRTLKSGGGGGILDHCIVRIKRINTHTKYCTDVYIHPKYHLE
jgi:hypothetical protein